MSNESEEYSNLHELRRLCQVFMNFIQGTNRGRPILLPPYVEDYVVSGAVARGIDAFVASLDLDELGVGRFGATTTGHPGFNPSAVLATRETKRTDRDVQEDWRIA